MLSSTITLCEMSSVGSSGLGGRLNGRVNLLSGVTERCSISMVIAGRVCDSCSSRKGGSVGTINKAVLRC